MTGKLQLEPSNPALCDVIAQRIAASPQQRITFAEYMDLALYQPQHGYYTSQQVKIGAQGDFATSPHLGADFGELLAVQFAQMWERLDRPRPFTLVEMGAGQGILAQDIIRYLHRHHFECFEALEYLIVEKSAAMAAEQQFHLRALAESCGNLAWRTWAELPTESIVGCCFSNELVDAFPVHQVMIVDGELREVYVALRDDAESEGPENAGNLGQFREVIGEISTPDLATYFERVGVVLPSPAYPEGYRTEVNLAALDWLATVANRLKQGYVLTIDYGYPAQRYYNPVRSQGTLQCYYHHAHHADPYLAIGYQDITAHVDFTALERQGEQLGLQTIGFTPQGLFLMALGLGDRIAALSHPEPDQTLQTILQRRDALHSLMNPMGLGNFGVLVQAKGLSQQQCFEPLKGLPVL